MNINGRLLRLESESGGGGEDQSFRVHLAGCDCGMCDLARTMKATMTGADFRLWCRDQGWYEVHLELQEAER